MSDPLPFRLGAAVNVVPLRTALAFVLSLLPLGVHAQGNAQTSEEPAKKLSNPIASLISVPFRAIYDENIRPVGEGHRFMLNIHPVIPIEFNKDSNLISRTILPITSRLAAVSSVMRL